jgi:phosphoribosylanthranilate isomerase
MSRVQICGFQRAEDALVAAQAGVDAIGLVFVPTARRRVTVEQAESLLAEFRGQWAEKPSPQWVGLFADQPVDEVNATVARLGLDAAQLCGAEGMGYCSQMTAPLYKVIAIDTTVPQSIVLPKLMVMLQRHTMAGHRPVLDAQVQGAYGGTGQTFDWSLAAGLSESYPLTLAGGLTPENVAEAVKMVRPWGVDTSSGVESDGQKDPARVRAFMEAVRQVDQAMKPKGLRALFSRGGR